LKILGIDPGYGIVGWSVIGDDFTAIEFGTITTSGSLSVDERLVLIHREINEIISRHRPESAAMERLFFQRNTTTAIDVAKAIGVITLTLSLQQIPISHYTPTQVKQALTGYGKADKKQVQEMVMKLFKLSEIPQPDDAADALAIAACHSCIC
jgi:crossover junction endodeoxyribonuclease RuvC